MASKPLQPASPRTDYFEPLPGVRCRARSGPRASHEWAPLRAGGFYCTACLARLRTADIEDWKLLLEIEAQRGDSTLSGEAYTTLSDMVANTVRLSPGERRLLRRLSAEPAYVVPHDELATAASGAESAEGRDRAALRQQVTALRRKLARLEVGVAAVPGIGYRLVLSASQQTRPANRPPTSAHEQCCPAAETPESATQN